MKKPGQVMLVCVFRLFVFLVFFFRLMVLFGFSAFLDLIRINLRKRGETCCFQFSFLFFLAPVFIFSSSTFYPGNNRKPKCRCSITMKFGYLWVS